MQKEEYLRVTLEGNFRVKEDGGLEIKAGRQNVKIVSIEKIETNNRQEK